MGSNANAGVNLRGLARLAGWSLPVLPAWPADESPAPHFPLLSSSALGRFPLPKPERGARPQSKTEGRVSLPAAEAFLSFVLIVAVEIFLSGFLSHFHEISL
jgi:hypothetical protein